MYDLFEEHYSPVVERRYRSGIIDYVRRTYRKELEKVARYYSERTHVVRTDHILSQILLQAYRPPSVDLPSTINAIAARAPYVAKAFQLADDITYARPLSYQFLQAREYLIYLEPDISSIFRAKKASDLQPLKVIRTNQIDYTYTPPTGKNHLDAQGHSVFAIDIVAMVYQYQLWEKERIATASQYSLELVTLGHEHYVASMLLPSVIPQLADHSVFQHVRRAHLALDTSSSSTVKLPIATYDISSKIDQAVQYYLQYYKDSQYTYETYLSDMPVLTVDSGLVAYQMPDLLPTTQLYWLMYLSRLQMIEFLIELGGVKGLRYNKRMVARMYVEIRRLQRENIYRRVLDRDTASGIYTTLDRLASLAGSV